MTETFDRRQFLGCIPKAPDPSIVGASFEEQFGVWSDDQIRTVLSAKKETTYAYLKRIGFWDIFTAKANQQRSNGCNGWLTANAYTLAKKLGGAQDNTIYSGAFNYSFMNGGHDQGSALIDGFHTATENGFVPVDVCPWNFIYRKSTQQFDAIGKQNLAADPFPVATIQGLKTALSMGCIGGVAIMVGDKLENPDSQGVAGVDNGPGNHATVVPEIIDKGTHFEFRDYLDWGPQHGQDGLINLVDAHFAQTIDQHQFWAMPYGQFGNQ